MKGQAKEVLVPTGWELVKLQDVCHTITDGTHRTPKYQDQGVRFISIMNIRPFKPVDWESYIKFIYEGEHKELTKRCKPEYDDILFPRIGTLGFAKRIDFEEEVSIFVGLGLLKPIKEVVRPKYLEYYMNSPLIYRLSHERATGSGRLTLPLAETRRFPFLLPPMPAQDRIVAKIEEMFSDLDAGVAALEGAKVNLKRYRAAVLKAAVEGKLTEQWREENPTSEPASELLKRILAERRKKWEEAQLAEYQAKGKKPPKNWRDKYKEPAQPDTTNLPPLPERWCWASIDQMSSVVRGASPRPAGDPRYFGGDDVPWITVGALTASDETYLESVSESLTQAGKQRSRYIPPDTLLLTNSGATLGVPKITMIGGCINDGSVALLGLDYPLKLYLYFVLKGMTRKLRAINQGAAQPNLNTGIVKEIVVPFPPSEEQQPVNAEIDRLLSLQRAVQTQLEVDYELASRLRHAILKRAFEGKLVEQDPTDEPASVLLERIKGERKATGTGDGTGAAGGQRRNTRTRQRFT